MTLIRTLITVSNIVALSLATPAPSLSIPVIPSRSVLTQPSSSSTSTNITQPAAVCRVGGATGIVENDFEKFDRYPIDFDNLCGKASFSVRFDGNFDLRGDVGTLNASTTGFAIMWAFLDAQNRVYTFEKACEVAPSNGCVLNLPGPARFNENLQQNWEDINSLKPFSPVIKPISGVIDDASRRELYNYLLGPDQLNRGLGENDIVYHVLREPDYCFDCT